MDYMQARASKSRSLLPFKQRKLHIIPEGEIFVAKDDNIVDEELKWKAKTV